jgi:hypothetical protein
MREGSPLANNHLASELRKKGRRGQAPTHTLLPTTASRAAPARRQPPPLISPLWQGRRREKEKGVGSSRTISDLRNLKQLNVNFGFEHAKRDNPPYARL